MAEQQAEDLEFRNGQVWQSPRGFFYRVEDVQSFPDGKRQATLRVGLEGMGRKSFRDPRKTQGWKFIAPMVTPDIVRRASAGEFD